MLQDVDVRLVCEILNKIKQLLDHLLVMVVRLSSTYTGYPRRQHSCIKNHVFLSSSNLYSVFSNFLVSFYNRRSFGSITNISTLYLGTLL